MTLPLDYLHLNQCKLFINFISIDRGNQLEVSKKFFTREYVHTKRWFRLRLAHP